MGLSLLVNSLPELHLSFSLASLYSNLNLIYLGLLWLLLLFFIFLLGIPSTPTFRGHEHTHRRRSRDKRRRKGGTQEGLRYYHREEQEKRRLISVLKSSLGQHHDTIYFRQLLCPKPSCEVYNNATTKTNRLLSSEALKVSAPSVSPVASTAPVTEPPSTQSSAFSAVTPGDLIPPPLPEPSPPPPSVLSPNPMTPLGNFLSPSQPGQTLPSEPSPPSESKFPVSHSPPQPKDLLSSTLTQCDFHQELPALHSTKTSFGGDPAAKLIDPRHLLFLSPDEHDSVQQYSNPKILEDLLKQKLIQLFWGLPSLHSESLPSAVHVSSDYSSIFIFNSMSNAFTGQEPPVLPYHLSPPLPEVYPQPSPQTLPQSQPLPLTQIQPQAHLQSPHPILSSSPISQIRACGVYFHRPKNETERLTSSEIQHLEYNVLQKKQEHLWGLPSVVQSSKKDSCPSVPTSPYRRPSKAHLAISISPVGFPLSSELREKFEHYLRKRLIQHRWGLPRRIRESLSLMKPLSEFSDIPESKSSCGFSWISVDKGQSSKNPNVGLSQPGNFYERGSEMFQLDQDGGKGAGHSQENDPKVHLSSDSERSSDKDVGNDSDMMSLSGENSIVSGQPGSQRQLEKGLKAHLSKKFEEINEGQLPGTVHTSRHTTKQTLPVKSNAEIKQRSLPPSVGGDNCLDTSQELFFLKSGTQQMLEAHITKFRVRMLRGLPTKVLESIEVLKLKHASSHSLMDPNSSSSTKLTSEVNAKSGGFMPLRGSSTSLHRDEVGTENSATVLNLPLPAASLVGKEGQGTWRQSPADIKHGLSEAIRKIWNSKPTLLPVTNSISGKTSQRNSLIANIQPPKLSARQAGTGHEPETKRVNASDRAEIQQGTNREKSEPASMSKVFRAIVRAEELDALQPKTGDVLTTRKLGISQRINVNESDGDTAVTAEKPSKISAPQDLNFSNLKKQVIAELKLKLEERKHRQAQGQPIDMSHDSDSLTYKASLIHAQSVSSVDKATPQVLHVHLEDRGVSVDPRQEPWLPKNLLRSCRYKIFPPAEKKMSPKGSKSEEHGAGDAGLRIFQPRRKRFPSQDTASEKGQSPPDSLFLSKMKSFFQWLHPEIKCEKQENPEEKGSPISSVQSRGPVKSRAVFPGMMQVNRVMSDFGKFRKEKLGSWPTTDSTCPKEPLPSAEKFGKALQKAPVQAQAELVQGHPFGSRAPSCKVTNTELRRQAPVFAAQSSTSSRHTRNEGRHPQKVVVLKDQQLCQKHPQSMPCKGAMPHPSPICRPQAAQVPPAILTTAEGTVLRGQSARFRHVMLLQKF